MNFFSRKAPRTGGAPDYIIAGLGNPGKKYERTRHNSGFIFADLLSSSLGVKLTKIQFKSVTAIADFGGHRCLIIKPQTFMNNSGQAVSEAAAYYKIPPENILVVFDDISLPCGTLRIRRKGSDGGHNGVSNIIYLLNSDNFPRIKLGIGEKPHPQMELADWVLSNFSQGELKELVTACENAVKAAEIIVGGNIEKAMSDYSR